MTKLSDVFGHPHKDLSGILTQLDNRPESDATKAILIALSALSERIDGLEKRLDDRFAEQTAALVQAVREHTETKPLPTTVTTDLINSKSIKEAVTQSINQQFAIFPGTVSASDQVVREYLIEKGLLSPEQARSQVAVDAIKDLTQQKATGRRSYMLCLLQGSRSSKRKSEQTINADSNEDLTRVFFDLPASEAPTKTQIYKACLIRSYFLSQSTGGRAFWGKFNIFLDELQKLNAEMQERIGAYYQELNEQHVRAAARGQRTVPGTGSFPPVADIVVRINAEKQLPAAEDVENLGSSDCSAEQPPLQKPRRKRLRSSSNTVMVLDSLLS